MNQLGLLSQYIHIYFTYFPSACAYIMQINSPLPIRRTSNDVEHVMVWRRSAHCYCSPVCLESCLSACTCVFTMHKVILCSSFMFACLLICVSIRQWLKSVKLVLLCMFQTNFWWETAVHFTVGLCVYRAFRYSINDIFKTLSLLIASFPLR